MATNKKETGVSTQSSTDLSMLTKADVPALLEQVSAKIKAIKGDIPDKPRTEKELDGFGYISKINSLDTLIKAHSSVTNREKAYKASAETIVPQGIKIPPFTLNGHGANAWVEDITNRAKIVARENELKKLETIKATLETHVSEEIKLANDLKKMQDLLTS